MKILLAYISGASGRSDPYINLLPSGLCYLHAVLREAGYDSLLANFSGWSPSAIQKQLSSLQPDIVGISQWTHNRHTSLETARLARRANPGSIIIMGGGHASFRYHEMLADGSPVDIVVLGEGEETLRELVEKVALGASWRNVAGIAFRDDGRVVLTEQRVPQLTLDTLPFPVRYLEHSVGVDLELQPEFVLTARGCPSACSFCSSPGFWGRRVRFRSPEDIVAEILYIRDRFGLIYFSLRDDTFTADRARAIEVGGRATAFKSGAIEVPLRIPDKPAQRRNPVRSPGEGVEDGLGSTRREFEHRPASPAAAIDKVSPQRG